MSGIGMRETTLLVLAYTADHNAHELPVDETKTFGANTSLAKSTKRLDCFKIVTVAFGLRCCMRIMASSTIVSQNW